MKVVDRLEKEISKAVDSIWSEVNIDVKFVPLVDLDLGDLGSDCLLSLAKLLKLTPEKIGGMVMEQVSENFVKKWNIEQGFLNVFLGIDLLGCFDCEKQTVPDSGYTIILAPRTEDTGGWQHARVAVLACLQFSALRSLKIPVQFYLGSKNFSATISDGDSLNLFREIVVASSETSSAGQVKDDLADWFLNSQRSSIFFWLAPRFLPRKEFIEFHRRHIAESKKITLKCPEQKWLSGGEFDYKLNQILNWEDQEVKALMTYLASARPSEELDLSTARSSEKNNLLWYLASTEKRTRNVFGQQIDPAWDCSLKESSQQTEVVLDQLERAICHRAVFLSEFFSRAGLKGEVGAFLTVLEDMLDAFNRKFNDPLFRLRCEKQELVEFEKKIIFRVDNILSDLVNSWEIFP